MKNLIKQIATLLRGAFYFVGMAIIFALLIVLNYVILLAFNPDFVVTL